MTVTNASTTNGRRHSGNRHDEYLFMHSKYQTASDDSSSIELWTVYYADIQPFIQKNVTTRCLVCTTKLTGKINGNLATIFSRIQYLHSKDGIKYVFHLHSFYNRSNTLGSTSVSFQTICPTIHMTYNIHFHYPRIGTTSIGILLIIHVSIKIFFWIFRKIIHMLSPYEIAWSHGIFPIRYTPHDMLPTGNSNE